MEAVPSSRVTCEAGDGGAKPPQRAVETDGDTETDDVDTDAGADDRGGARCEHPSHTAAVEVATEIDALGSHPSHTAAVEVAAEIDAPSPRQGRVVDDVLPAAVPRRPRSGHRKPKAFPKVEPIRCSCCGEPPHPGDPNEVWLACETCDTWARFECDFKARQRRRNSTPHALKRLFSGRLQRCSQCSATNRTKCSGAPQAGHVDADGVGAARVRALRYLRRHASTYVTEEMAAHTLEQLGQLWLSPTPLPRSSSFAGTDILCFAPKKDDDDAVRAAHEQQRSGFEGVKRERTAAEAAAALYASLTATPELAHEFAATPPSAFDKPQKAQPTKPNARASNRRSVADSSQRSRAGPSQHGGAVRVGVKDEPGSPRAAQQRTGGGSEHQDPSLCGEDDWAYEQERPKYPVPKKAKIDAPRGQRCKKVVSALVADGRTNHSKRSGTSAANANASAAGLDGGTQAVRPAKEESGPVAPSADMEGIRNGLEGAIACDEMAFARVAKVRYLLYGIQWRLGLDPASIAATAPYVAALKNHHKVRSVAEAAARLAVATPMWRGAVEDAERRGSDVHLLDQVRAQREAGESK